MARYEYRCEACGETFVREERMSEHGSEASPECPECGSGESRKLMSEFVADIRDRTCIR